MKRFKVGDVIFHQRYQYRGVVFGCDSHFKGDDDWYHSNRTQPNREQPWYHVLVDEAQHTTYVAQENLEADVTGDPVSHPLIDKIFASFHDGRYYNHSIN